MTTRRALLRALGSGTLITIASPVSGQPPSKIPRVAMLVFGTRENAARAVALFRQRLRELGYLEGKTVLIEERYAGGNAQRLPELARELVQSRVDVIVAVAVAATVAARQATSTIPIVTLTGVGRVGN